MISLRIAVGILLACASAVAQIPLRVSALEIEQISLRAVATKHAVIVDLVIAEGWHAYSRDVGAGMPLAIKLAADCDFLAKANLSYPKRTKAKSLARRVGTEDQARAKRCLKRYVHPSIYPDGVTWAAWYVKHRDNLVFVDSAGFWWMLDPTKVQ